MNYRKKQIPTKHDFYYFITMLCSNKNKQIKKYVKTNEAKRSKYKNTECRGSFSRNHPINLKKKKNK